MPLAAAEADRPAGKHLTFRLNRQEFAIPVSRVRAIMSAQKLAAATQMPPYVRGVVHLRGSAVPVVDLRRKLGLPEARQSWRTSIVCVQVRGAKGPRPVGMLVDSVSGVLELAGSRITGLPDSGLGPAAAYLLGVAKINSRVRLLLDLDRVLASESAALVERSPQAQ